MSVPDPQMEEFFRLLFPQEPGPSGHPGDEKRRLGRLVAQRFHGPGAGEAAEAHFDRLFKDRAAPDEVPEITVAAGAVHMPALLVDGLGVGSRSEARRMLTQGGVSVDGEVLGDLDVDASALDGRIVRAGKKRFVRVRIS